MTEKEKNIERFPWWKSAVIYQIYPRSFKDTTGNGVGDLAGVLEKLDYLSEVLGLDAIWLSPFYPSPMADFGYDVANYTDVHPLFGDLGIFDRLVSRLHARGLHIIIDLVPNHTSDHHPWFLESRSSRGNPKRDWYVWVDPKPDGSPPNNWLSVFGGSAWEWDRRTGQYYLHSFLKEQPDLNWRNPEAKEAIFDVVRFWLDRGVDGFRIDVAHFIMKDPQMRDNPVNETMTTFIHKPLGEYDRQIHIYDKGHADVHQVYRELRTLLETYQPDREIVSIGEIHIFDLDEWALYYGEDLDELHMPFNFSLLKVKWTAQDVRQSIENLESALPAGAWPNYVLGNHDESRIATRLGRRQARIAAMLLLTLRGTPTLYYGDEIGMRDVTVPQEHQQDPWGARVPGLGRDPCRTPMQWSDAPNAGFSSLETSGLWLPLADDYRVTNVEHQLADQTSILNLYRQLLALRKVHPVLHRGDYQTIQVGPEECFVYQRTLADQPRIVIGLNFSERESQISLLGQGSGTILLSTHLDRIGTQDLSNIILRPHEGMVIEISQGGV